MIKDIAKRSIYHFSISSVDQILSKIKDKDVISFDVFDTLIKREVEPVDVYSVIEEVIKDRLENNISNFAVMRKKAEEEAILKNNGFEVTLEDIYACMPIHDELRNEIIKLECNIEISLTFANLQIKRIYDECLKLGKTIYFISDMYLPQDVILKILHNNGYSIGKLYVSSESGYTKRGGKLFEFVQRNEHLTSEQWLHIGDSFFSDYVVPRKNGIKAMLIERNLSGNEYIQRSTYKDNANYRRLTSFINSHLVNYSNTYERIGYAVLGPMLYGFSKWLEREIPENETILFLARDGALLKKAFDLISNRPTAYFRISRQAVNSSFIDHAASPKIVLDSGVRAVHKNSFQKEWAIHYGLTEEEINVIFSNNNLSFDKIVHSRSDEEQLLNVIWPTIKEHAAGQHKLLQRYLEQIGASNKCAIVDVGWRGTIQTFLRNSEFTMNGIPVQWNGYYLGRAKWHEEDVSARSKKGFLFDSYPGDKIYDSYMNSVSFCESFFLSTDGTTNAYVETETGTVEPVLGPPENSMDPIVLSIQSGGMQFVRDICKSPAKEIIDLDATASAGNYEAIARVPSSKTLKLFKDFNFYDVNSYKIVSEHSIIYYFAHPKEFIHDAAVGKSWFLKSVLKIPFPYIKFLNLIRKLLAYN